MFRDVSNIFGQLFQKAALPVRSAFGLEATPREVLTTNLRIGLHHILAHGRFESEKDAMAASFIQPVMPPPRL